MSEAEQPRAEDDHQASLSILAETLGAFETWEWEALHDCLMTGASLPLNEATSRRLLDRLSEALPSSSGQPAERLELSAALLMALRPGNEELMADPKLAESLGKPGVQWLSRLRRTFADWIGDLVRADVEGFRNWNRVTVIPGFRVQGEVPANFIDIRIHLVDGSVVNMEMSPASAFRLVRSLAGHLSDLPPILFDDVPSSTLEELRAATDELIRVVAEAIDPASSAGDSPPGDE